MQRPCWEGLANRPKVFMIPRTVSLSRAMWRSLRLALRGKKPTRGAPPALVDAMGSGDAARTSSSRVTDKRHERAPDRDTCVECKVLHASFRAKTDWNDFKDDARTPDGTKDTNEVSDNRKGSTMDFPEQVTEEAHMGWNIKCRLWNREHRGVQKTLWHTHG